MRISTRLAQDFGINAMLDQQARVSQTQLQLATGKRLLTPADDPTGAARILELEKAVAATEQYNVNANAADSRLKLEETALQSIMNAIHRTRELAVQGNNAVNNVESRRAIADEVKQLLAQMLETANTRDANGEYLFSGYQGLTRPFSRDSAGNFPYAGDDGQRFLQIAPDRQIAIGDSGTEVFRAIRNGNGTFTTMENPANTGTGIISPGQVIGAFSPETFTISFTQPTPTDPVTYEVVGSVSGVVIPAGTLYQEDADLVFGGAQVSFKGTPADGDSFAVSPSMNQDLFTTVQNLAIALESYGDSSTDGAHLGNAVNRFLVDIDQAVGNVLNVETRIGARLNAIDNQRDINESFVLHSKQAMSEIQDLDYAEASSRLNLQLLGLQAAQQSFIKIQGLSLFNFLR
ncbi:MAG: flagellar hook-associated protein FlgL [Gammaproteobacteria bacterium]|nr:flagellar hook-associated protein FlgL [Gammaproteobacteria bacterium]